MGRLGGFRYRDITRRLKSLGFEFHRQAAGSHEIWHHPQKTPLAYPAQAMRSDRRLLHKSGQQQIIVTVT